MADPQSAAVPLSHGHSASRKNRTFVTRVSDGLSTIEIYLQIEDVIRFELMKHRFAGGCVKPLRYTSINAAHGIRTHTSGVKVQGTTVILERNGMWGNRTRASVKKDCFRDSLARQLQYIPKNLFF